jgi:4-amino-4-deoxy-L-arabinose transferase-like glycosyltransferase
MSNPQFIMASTRANPDIYLTLFMLLSFMGFSALIVGRRTEKRYYWYAYAGVGLAIATKGMLGVVFAVYVWMYVLADRSISVRRMIYLPAAAAGSVIAGWWYVLMKFMHGGDALGSFVHDQVGRGMVGSFGAAVSGMLSLFGQGAIFLFPWSFVAAEVSWRERGSKDDRDIFKQLDDYVRFMLPWVVLGVIIFGLNARVRLRYLVPYLPLVAVWIAMLIARAATAVRLRAVRHQATVFVVALMIAAAMAVTIYTELGDYAIALVVAVSVITIYAVIRKSRSFQNCLRSAIALGLGILVVFPLSYIILLPFVTPDAAADTLRYIESNVPEGEQIYCVITGKLYGKMRLMKGGDIELVYHKKHHPVEVPSGAVVIVSDKILSDFRAKIPGYNWEMIADKLGRIKPNVVIGGLARGELKECLRTHREHIFAGKPVGNEREQNGDDNK